MAAETDYRRSRDNFPNPRRAANPYAPTNSPALTTCGMRFISHRASRSVSGALLAALAGCAPPQHGIAGRWQLSWHGRIGTEQAIVVLQQGGQAVSGSFAGAQGSLPLSGWL